MMPISEPLPDFESLAWYCNFAYVNLNFATAHAPLIVQETDLGS